MKRENKSGLPLSQWIEKNCRHPDADPQFAGKEVRLMQWQKTFCDKLWPAPGERQARYALCLTSVKTGKSSMAAWICLSLLQGDYEGEFSNIGVLGPTLDQSHILKGYIQSAAFNSGIECRPSGRDGLKFSNRKQVNFLTGRPQSKQGRMFSSLIMDDAAEADPDGAQFFFNMIDFQTKGLCLMLSNPPSRRDNAIKSFIRQRESKDFVKHCIKTPLSLNWKKQATWLRANPSLKDRPELMRVYREKVKRLSHNPAELDLFKRLWLAMHNYSDGAGFFSPSLIQRVPKSFDKEAEKEATWFAGVDMSSSRDLTAVTLSTEHQGKTILKCYGFLPKICAEGKLDRNVKRARFLFDDPEKNGVFLSRRDTIDPKEISNFLQDPDQGLGLLNIYPRVACDRARVFAFENDDTAFEFLPVSQSPLAITPATLEFERRGINKEICCNSELLKFCLGNARMSPPENAAVRAIFKTRSEDSVDAAISSILSVYMLKKFGPEANALPQVYSF